MYEALKSAGEAVYKLLRSSALKVENPQDLQQKLASSGVIAALRGEYLRLSFHFFNDFSEVEEVAALVQTFEKK